MNIDVKIFKKIIANQINIKTLKEKKTLKESYTMLKWGLFILLLLFFYFYFF